MAIIKTIFKKDIENRKKELKEQDKIHNFLGLFKLALVILIGYSTYNFYTKGQDNKILALITFELLIFVIACIYHSKIINRIKNEMGLIKISENNLKRIDGSWINFEDIGKEFVDVDHDYAVDLDIVGKKSLFQFLNSTNTYYGRDKFAKDLLYANFSSSKLRKRQDAIKELSEDYIYARQAEHYFSKIGIDDSFPNLIEELNHKSVFIKNKFITTFLKFLPYVTCFMITLAFIFRKYNIAMMAVSLLILQTFLWLIGFLKTHNYFGILNTLPYKINLYDDVISFIEKKDFSCEELKAIQLTLSSNHDAIKELFKISDRIAQCHNAIFAIILNIFFLLDYKNAIDLENWKRNYGGLMENYFKELGEFESLLSFANLPRVCDNTTLPLMLNEDKIFNTKNLGHPLINNDTRVCNDFSLHNEIFIISGSNMSGKTTFMRTIGINMILASTGSYVCANEMCFSNMKLVTSMRIVDNLNEGISTFYAELKRIKKIVDDANKNNNTLFFIDEIFRGTNSVDRLKGAKGVLEKLQKLGVSGIITTHDLEVCSLEESFPNIKNYSFCENYVNDDIHFDYKVKIGKSKTTNAEFLLKKIGIL